MTPFLVKYLLLSIWFLGLSHADDCDLSVISEISRVGAHPRGELIPTESAEGNFYAPHLLEPNVANLRKTLLSGPGTLRYFAMSSCSRFLIAIFNDQNGGQRLSMYRLTPEGTEVMHTLRWRGDPFVLGNLSAGGEFVALVSESDKLWAGSVGELFSGPDNLMKTSIRARSEWYDRKNEKPTSVFVGFLSEPEEEDHTDRVIAVVSELTVFHFRVDFEEQELKRHRTPTRLMLPNRTKSPVQGVTVHDNAERLGIWRANTYIEVMKYNPLLRRYDHDPQAREILSQKPPKS